MPRCLAPRSPRQLDLYGIQLFLSMGDSLPCRDSLRPSSNPTARIPLRPHSILLLRDIHLYAGLHRCLSVRTVLFSTLCVQPSSPFFRRDLQSVRPADAVQTDSPLERAFLITVDPQIEYVRTIALFNRSLALCSHVFNGAVTLLSLIHI